MSSSHEVNRSKEPEVPYGVFREGTGQVLETVCGIAAVRLALYPDCQVSMPGSAPNLAPLLPVLIQDDFRHTTVKMPMNFLRLPATQEALREEVPSLNEALPVSSESVRLFRRRENYSIGLKMTGEGYEKIAAERNAVCTALARLLEVNDFDSSQVPFRMPTVKILRAPKGSAPEHALIDLKEAIKSELPAEFTLQTAMLPETSDKVKDDKRRFRSGGNEPVRQPRAQTRQTADDIDRMLNLANLRPSRSRGTRR